MRFLDLVTGQVDAERVALSRAVATITHVDICKCHACPSRTGKESLFTIVFFDREGPLLTLFEELRGAVQIERGQPVVQDQERARLWGRLLWSHLHPDIGIGVSAGHHAHIGKRRTYFHSFFSWLADHTGGRDLWSVLAARGRVEYPDALPSFRGWKNSIHFGDDDILPMKAEVAEADNFLNAVGVELAKAECRHRLNPRWANRAKDGRLPGEFYNWVRKDSTRLVRQHSLSLGAQRAARMLSYAAALEMGNRLAKDVLQALPRRTLDAAGRKLFKAMWMVPRVGVDQRGRFDLPIMASPVLASALDYLLEIDDEGDARDKENIVADLVDFLTSGVRNEAVDIALGFSFYYRRWLDAEREGERDKTRRRLGRGHPEAQDGTEGWPRRLWKDGKRSGRPRHYRSRRARNGKE